MEKKKKGNGYGKGTFIETSMFLSPAFLSLGNKGTAKKVSACSIKVLILFLGKRQYKKIPGPDGRKKTTRIDDNKFTLTYKELESRGIKQNAATRGIDELLSKGFIQIIDPGGTFEKHKAVYSLENDFILWRPGNKPVYQRKRDILRGFQKPKSKPKTIIACVDGGHPHVCQRGTPHKKTRTSTGDTPTLTKMSIKV